MGVYKQARLPNGAYERGAKEIDIGLHFALFFGNKKIHRIAAIHELLK